jgi:chitin disaccharide deacetylase
MTSERRLIVNADDFGLSAGVNRGIIEAHERGIVTSASLMVRWAAAEEAAAYARAHPALGVGLHVDLGEWEPSESGWAMRYEVVRGDDARAIADEVAEQLASFRRLVGREPTHIDSHQHVHLVGPARDVLMEAAKALDIPLRGCDARVRYCGDFYGQARRGYSYPEGISVERLVTIIAGLPEGITEVACHPGYADDVETFYRTERAAEITALCDPRARAAVVAAGAALCSFGDATCASS